MPRDADKEQKNTLKKKDKLKSSLIIEALYKENRFVVSYPLKCFYSFTEAKQDKPAVSVAFTVPKKTFKLAVDRNALKRRVREAYRLNYKKVFESFIEQNEKQLHLFFIYIGKEEASYSCIEEAMQKMLKRLMVG